jgi:hypothetical protein
MVGGDFSNGSVTMRDIMAFLLDFSLPFALLLAVSVALNLSREGKRG